jgi:Ca2+-binding RTX toxin-like protein
MDTLLNIETVYGSSSSANTLIGNSADNTLVGGYGNDTLSGGSGNDNLTGGAGNDKLDGGAGIDTAYYTSAATSVAVNLALTTAQNTIGAGTDTLLNIENLSGSTYNDSLTGDTNNNSLYGLGGNDILSGEAGNDTLDGGAGDDVLDGGAGTDTASYTTATAGVTVNLTLTTAQNTIGAGTDTLLNIEKLSGNTFNDTLTGDTNNNTLYGLGGNDILSGGLGNDTLDGGAGNDTLDGGAGTDTASYASASAGVLVNLALTAAQNTHNAGTDTLLNIENLRGSAYSDTLLGNIGANTLFGGAGNDLLAGGLGNDTLTGGIGQDTFAFNSTLGAGNIDTLTDFNVANDTIRLSKGIFTTLTTPGVLAAAAFKIIGNGGVADSTDHLLYNTATGSLSYDADGSGAGAAVPIAILGTGLAMTNADFMVA